MKKFTRTISLTLILIVSILLTSCNNLVHSHGPSYLRITQIEVAEDDWFLGNLEIEVHVYDYDTYQLLGCSGNDQGLAGVDSSHTLYYVDAHFVKPGYGDDRLHYNDVRNRRIFLEVIEDDNHKCPAPFDPEFDDHVGTSYAFHGSELSNTQILSFDDVYHLRIDAYSGY